MAERKKSRDSSKMLDIQPRLLGKVSKISEMALPKNYRMFFGAKVLWPPECPDDVLEFSISEAQELMKTYTANAQTTEAGLEGAEKLKKAMDERFEGKWHVIFGTHFGAHLTHEKMKFLFFYIDNVAFLFMKMGR